MGCNYKNWVVTIKKAPNSDYFIKYYFWNIENFNFINCCALNVSLDFYVIQIYIEIVFNMTRNFGIKIFRIPSKCGNFLLNSFLNGWLNY